MAYLTQDDFEEYGGVKIGEMVFERHELNARRLIDRMTRNRLQQEKKPRECVKMCMHELIGAMIAEEASGGIGGREIASANNDGISVTFSAGNGGIDRRLALIVRRWLEGEKSEQGVHLLYAGVG